MSMMENGYLFSACYHFADEQNVTLSGKCDVIVTKIYSTKLFHKEIRHFKRDYWF